MVSQIWILHRHRHEIPCAFVALELGDSLCSHCQVHAILLVLECLCGMFVSNNMRSVSHASESISKIVTLIHAEGIHGGCARAHGIF
jgi:hypothetical protein